MEKGKSGVLIIILLIAGFFGWNVFNVLRDGLNFHSFSAGFIFAFWCFYRLGKRNIRKAKDHLRETYK